MKKEELEYKIRLLELTVKKLEENERKMSKLFEENSPYKELLLPFFQPISSELREWSKTNYDENPYYVQERKHKTASGKNVRSKSEAMIDFVLSMKKIPFHYEEKLQLEDVILYPDFTIRHPQTGKYYYWEHFGMMDDAKYVKNASSKIQLYSRNGIIPGIHLIITYETKDYPLSMEEISRLVDYYF